MADQHLTAGSVDGDVLEVVGGVLVEDQSGDGGSANGGVQLEVGGDRQAVAQAEVDNVDGLLLTTRGSSCVAGVGSHRPGPGGGAGEQVGGAVGEVLGVVEGDLGREHLGGDVVEVAARVVGPETDQPGVEVVGPPLDDSRCERVGEVVGAVEQHGDVGAVHCHEKVVPGAVLDTAGDRALGDDVPAVGVTLSHDQLVDRVVEPGELEVGRAVVVEDDVGVALPARGWLDDLYAGFDLEVHRQVPVVVPDRGSVLTERSSRDAE